ncbi:MAG TPA: hypothetical protein VK553_06470 [Candidatus Nitrosopolaris rasttigaisensis]|nr:hypothetical protein [Candidatus Nitrosopolaris rasttigaisensis]
MAERRLYGSSDDPTKGKRKDIGTPQGSGVQACWCARDFPPF